jgi:hypothetical protein
MTRMACKVCAAAAMFVLVGSPRIISVRAAGSIPSTTQIQLTASNVAYYSSAYILITSQTQTAGNDGGVPTGVVTFFDQNGALSSPITLSPAGIAMFKLEYPAAGTYKIYATYSGDATYLPSSTQSSPQVLTVTAEPTTTAVDANPSNPAPGAAVAIHAVVKPAWEGTPTGTVTIYDSGGHPLQTAPLVGNQATLWTTAPTQPATSVNYYAAYSGDNNFLSSSFGVEVTSNGTVVVTGGGSNPSGGSSGVIKTTGSANTGAGVTATTVPTAPASSALVSATPHVNSIPADTATAATSTISPSTNGSVLPSDVLDTSVVAPTQSPQLLGSALTFGTALQLGKYLIPLNIVVGLWLLYAAHRGRRLTALALQPR